MRILTPFTCPHAQASDKGAIPMLHLKFYNKGNEASGDKPFNA